MSILIVNTQDISIDGGSRAARWKNLRDYLEKTIAACDEGNDGLAKTEAEIKNIRKSYLKLAEIIQTLSDLANEEIQREISLTLNDTDYDVVIDTPVFASESPVNEERTEAYTKGEFIEALKSVPGIGQKRLADISNHLDLALCGATQSALNLEIENGELHG